VLVEEVEVEVELVALLLGLVQLSLELVQQ